MLKGHVFSKQLFENPIFALFINTFLNGENGVSNNYKNGMQPTYNGSTLTIDSGAVCIQGRFLEEDTSTQIATGTNNAYCKLIIEIDLDKQNTESQLNQAAYKVITSASSYPTLTQTDIVKNVSGIYQYELARFRTSASGITDFQDMRTFLDFSTIYAEIRQEYGEVLQELKDELASVIDGSDYLLKSAGGTVEGEIVANGGVKGNLTGNVKGNVTGNVSGSSGSCTGNAATATKATTATTCTGNAATATKATTATTCTGNAATATKLQTARTIALSGDVTGSASFNGSANVTITTNLANVTSLSGTITLTASSSSGTSYSQTNLTLNYPSGYNKNNTIVLGFKCKLQGTGTGNYIFGYTPDKMSTSAVSGAYPRTIRLDDNSMYVSVYNLSTSRKLDYVIYLMKT